MYVVALVDRIWRVATLYSMDNATIKGNKDNPQNDSAIPNVIPNMIKIICINITPAVITGQYLNAIIAHFLQSL